MNAPPVYAYVLYSSSMQAFSVSQSAQTPGKIAPAGSPITVGPFDGPNGIVVDPTNSYVHITDVIDGTVSAFAILQSGPDQEAPIPNGPPVASGLRSSGYLNPMVANPNGKFLYVGNPANGTILTFSIVQSGADAGQLLANGVPVKTGSTPRYLAVDPSGRYLYATNFGDSTVSAFTIVQSGPNAGQLVKNGAPVSVPSPTGIAVDPSGKYAYVASATFPQPATLAAFRIVQSGATAGQLMPNGAPVTIYGTPLGVVVDPLGLYVIVSGPGGTSGGGIITQTGPGAGQVTSGAGGAPAPFALGGGNVGFNVRASTGFGSLNEVSDYWVAGGNLPSFVFEPLYSLEPLFDYPSAVAATN